MGKQTVSCRQRLAFLFILLPRSSRDRKPLTESSAVDHPFVEENGQVGKENPTPAQQQSSAMKPTEQSILPRQTHAMKKMAWTPRSAGRGFSAWRSTSSSAMSWAAVGRGGSVVSEGSVSIGNGPGKRATKCPKQIPLSGRREGERPSERKEKGAFVFSVGHSLDWSFGNGDLMCSERKKNRGMVWCKEQKGVRVRGGQSKKSASTPGTMRRLKGRGTPFGPPCSKRCPKRMARRQRGQADTPGGPARDRVH